MTCTNWFAYIAEYFIIYMNVYLIELLKKKNWRNEFTRIFITDVVFVTELLKKH